MSVGWGKLDEVSYQLREKSEDCKINILEQSYHKQKDLYTANLHSYISPGIVIGEYSESKAFGSFFFCQR